MQEKLREYLTGNLDRPNASNFFESVFVIEQYQGKHIEEALLKEDVERANSCKSYKECVEFISETAAKDPHKETIEFSSYSRAFLTLKCCPFCVFYTEKKSV